MASPTASPTTTPTTTTPGVEGYSHTTIHTRAEFSLECHGSYFKVWLGNPLVGSIEFHDVQSADRFINELCEGLAHLRHSAADAKRCEGRGRVGV